MKKLTVFCVLALSGLSFCGVAAAAEISELKRQLAELQTRIEKLEAQQKQVIAKEVDKAVEKKQVSAMPGNLKWLENIKIGGDFRFRYEGIDAQSGGKWGSSVNRNRIRARLNLDARVNDDIDLGFRLASGSADPVSTNQTLGDSFSSKDIWLDRAYFDWHPGTMKGFNFIGGKMPLPFYRVGSNQLIWDDDLNPEGLAAKYVLPLSSSLNAYVDGGGFWVGHADTSTAPDTSLWAVQCYLKNTFEDKGYLLGGMSYYNYGNIESAGDLATVWKGSSNFFGNTSTGGNFKYDYDIVEGFAEYGFKLADFPVAVFGDYAHNTASPGSKSNGWLVGTTFNMAKDPGSWQIGYDYRDIDSDAVIGQFNDSDFIGGGTDGKGHRFNFVYQLSKNFQAGLTYFLNEKKNSAEDKYRRLQADMVFKF
ncbi:MAG: putative porin [Planctomycetota bacterium]